MREIVVKCDSCHQFTNRVSNTFQLSCQPVTKKDRDRFNSLPDYEKKVLQDIQKLLEEYHFCYFHCPAIFTLISKKAKEKKYDREDNQV